MEAPTLLQLAYIFLGGGSGSLLRYLLGYLATRITGAPSPWATWMINVLGSFLIGYLLGRLATLPAESSQPLRFLLVVGFCGGFTTFSTFSADLLGYLRGGQTALALTYALLSVTASLLAVYGGSKLAD